MIDVPVGVVVGVQARPRVTLQTGLAQILARWQAARRDSRTRCQHCHTPASCSAGTGHTRSRPPTRSPYCGRSPTRPAQSPPAVATAHRSSTRVRRDPSSPGGRQHPSERTPASRQPPQLRHCFREPLHPPRAMARDWRRPPGSGRAPGRVALGLATAVDVGGGVAVAALVGVAEGVGGGGGRESAELAAPDSATRRRRARAAVRTWPWARESGRPTRRRARRCSTSGTRPPQQATDGYDQTSIGSPSAGLKGRHRCRHKALSRGYLGVQAGERLPTRAATRGWRCAPNAGTPAHNKRSRKQSIRPSGRRSCGPNESSPSCGRSVWAWRCCSRSFSRRPPPLTSRRPGW